VNEMSYSRSLVQVPKHIHAVWVGGVLNKIGKNNLAHWQTANPDYQVNLWIDSSTYYQEQEGEKYKIQQAKYRKLKKWARRNHIDIYDRNEASQDPEIAKLNALKDHPAEQYYCEEIKEPGENLAAVSDIF